MYEIERSDGTPLSESPTLSGALLAAGTHHHEGELSGLNILDDGTRIGRSHRATTIRTVGRWTAEDRVEFIIDLEAFA